VEGNKCEKEKGRLHGSERDENVTTLICTEQLLSVIIPLSYLYTGAVLSAKTQSDQRLQEARYQAKKIIHAFHKCQTKLEKSEVCAK